MMQFCVLLIVEVFVQFRVLSCVDTGLLRVLLIVQVLARSASS